MSLNAEQLAAAARAHFDAQCNLINTLTHKTLESVESVIALNVNTVTSSVQDAASAAQLKGLQINTQASAVTLTISLAPIVDKALEYCHHLAKIGESLHGDFSKAAGAQMAETRKTLVIVLGEAVKHAPAGAESTIALIQTILTNADVRYEQRAQDNRRTGEMPQKNVRIALVKCDGKQTAQCKPMQVDAYQ